MGSVVDFRYNDFYIKDTSLTKSLFFYTIIEMSGFLGKAFEQKINLHPIFLCNYQV